MFAYIEKLDTSLTEADGIDKEWLNPESRKNIDKRLKNAKEVAANVVQMRERAMAQMNATHAKLFNISQDVQTTFKELNELIAQPHIKNVDPTPEMKQEMVDMVRKLEDLVSEADIMADGMGSEKWIDDESRKVLTSTLEAGNQVVRTIKGETAVKAEEPRWSAAAVQVGSAYKNLTEVLTTPLKAGEIPTDEQKQALGGAVIKLHKTLAAADAIEPKWIDAESRKRITESLENGVRIMQSLQLDVSDIIDPGEELVGAAAGGDTVHMANEKANMMFR